MGRNENPVKNRVRRLGRMDTEFVKRYVVITDEGQFVVYASMVEIEEWEEVLELTIPASMAQMLDYTQHAFYTMQGYLTAQWRLMQARLEAEELVLDGDQQTFLEEFNAIIRHNDMEEPDEEEDY